MTDTTSEISDTFNNVIDAATRFYQRASRGTTDVVQSVDPFVKQRPYMAVAAAAALGMFVGMLMAERRPRIIYVKPRD